MAGIPEPILVAALRALSVAQKSNLRHHLDKGTSILVGHGKPYVDTKGAACLAFLAAYPEIPAGPIDWRSPLPESAQHAYWAMARAPGVDLGKLVAAEMSATEEDIIASIEEAIR